MKRPRLARRPWAALAALLALGAAALWRWGPAWSPIFASTPLRWALITLAIIGLALFAAGLGRTTETTETTQD